MDSFGRIGFEYFPTPGIQIRSGVLLGLIWVQIFTKTTRIQQLAGKELTLNVPISTKVVCFSHLLKCLRSLYGKQCGTRPDCSLFWVHTVCFYTLFVSNVRQLFAADDSSRRHFQMHFFLGALRVNICLVSPTELKSLVFYPSFQH